MGQENVEKVFTCPHCNNLISVVAKTEILEVVVREDGNINWDSGLSLDQKTMISEVKDSGLFTQFQRTVAVAKSTQLPRSLERFFISFLRNAGPVPVPRFVLEYFLGRFAGHISFLCTDGICAITCDGIIHGFCPQTMITNKGSHLTHHLNIEDIRVWFEEPNSLESSDKWGAVGRMKSISHQTRTKPRASV